MANEALSALLVCPLGRAPLKREGDALICTKCGPQLFDRRRYPEHAHRGSHASQGLQLRRRSSVCQIRRSETRLSPVHDETSMIGPSSTSTTSPADI